MSEPAASGSEEKVSKVSFFPVEDRTGENKALIVTIKKVAPEGHDLPRIMETPRRSVSADAKKKTRTSARTSSEKSKTRATMTETSRGKSFSTQTSVEIPVPSLAHAGRQAAQDSGLCLKHAAQNISTRASSIPSEKVSLCSNCSKSMLSYIFLVQDFLDSLAKEICGSTDTKDCVQCLRQENRLLVSAHADKGAAVAPKVEKRSSKSRRTGSGQTPETPMKGDDSRSSQKSAPVKDSRRRDVRKYEETAEQLIHRSLSEHQRDHQKDSHGTPLPQDGSPTDVHGQKTIPHTRDQGQWQSHPGLGNQQGEHPSHSNSGEHHAGYQGPGGSNGKEGGHQTCHDSSSQQGLQGGPAVQYPPVSDQEHGRPPSHQGVPPASQGGATFIKPLDRQQPDFTETVNRREYRGEEGSKQDEFRDVETVTSPFSDGLDHIVSTLSNAEREVYDAARNGAGWEGLSEPQERLISSSTSQIPSQAYVTMCRNNAEALGCLVVGTSLLLSRTSRTLCVVVSDGVSNAFRAPLSSVFHVVQCVRAMDSLGSTKLALLEQPELGISFEKLNVWRLLQFNKCVFLNPDTLVIQNCDELFCHGELSAVPDIGWPDCFNSGVFVFVPSMHTFWQLLDFAEKQGSYDGGDQGLLNSYFNNWSDDINKKLSFIYNLMANVSYTYTPAYKQFGRNVKIVQFHGSFKPWHVKFFSRTGQISPASSVHPTYVQFVHVWINIFRISALRQLTKEIQSYALSQEVICAVELLRFFPLPTESEAEFYLTPPSVRLRLAERKLQKPAKISEDVQRRKSAEFTPLADRDKVFDSPEEDSAADVSRSSEETAAESSAAALGSEKYGASVAAGEGVMTETATTTASAAETEVTGASEADVPKKTVKNPLPGAEVGNYQGMKAWEQGRMDYQGTDSSETIIKRLQFLMDQPK